jgi:hypothetical protein
MSFKVEIKNNIQDAFHAFSQLKRVEIARAAKRAINRTLTTLRKESVPVIKQELNIKSSVLKSYISLQKAEGRGFADLSGSLVFQSRGLALIDFVRGSKQPTQQKGVAVKRRKKVKVQVKPGRTYVVRGGFIANTQSRGLQVFKRTKANRSHLLMQTTPSLGQLLLRDTKNKIAATLQTRGAQLFQANLIKDLEFRVSDTFKRMQANRKYK